MKKLLFFLSFATILSCSKSDDDSNSNGSSANFNPPAWIQGTWMQDVGGTPFGGFKFTSNNICQKTTILTDQCFKEMLDLYNSAGANATVSELIKSDTEYKCSWTVQGITQTYYFRKINSTKIEWISGTSINPILIKQ
ncbi:MAG: hypothetical protein Q7T12_03655 [Flavobacterium sp.]|nr:hypothetical protein [Flavobacterium sp.]